MRKVWLFSALVLMTVGCTQVLGLKSDPQPLDDAGGADAAPPPVDSGNDTTPPTDAAHDTAQPLIDAGVDADAATDATGDTSLDATPPIDAGPRDTGTPDTGLPDTGTPDTGTPDTGTPDTGTPDTGTPDTGIDAGPPPCVLGTGQLGACHL